MHYWEYGAPTLSTVNVVKWAVLKIHSVKKIGNNKRKLSKKHFGGCEGSPKFSAVYLKWPILGRQRAPRNSVLAPSVLVLYAVVYIGYYITKSFLWEVAHKTFFFVTAF